MNKNLMENNLQQNFVSMKNAVTKSCFPSNIRHCHRVVNGPIRSCPNPARTPVCKPEPEYVSSNTA